VGYSAKNITSNVSAINIILDTAGPALSMAYPPANGYTNSRRPGIKVVVNDTYAGCDLNDSWLEVNGIKVDALMNKSACTMEYVPLSDLSEGQFQVDANASDTLGNSAAASFRFTTIFTPPAQPIAALAFNSTHALLNWSDDNLTGMLRYDIYYSLGRITDIGKMSPIASVNGTQKYFAKTLGNDGPEVHFAVIAIDQAGNPSPFENEVYADSPIYVAPQPVGYSTPSRLKIDTTTDKSTRAFGTGEITVARTFSSTNSSTTAVFVVENT
ncbi:MAG TPA: hypothetical protein PLO51_01335, partial [Candidatus Micrarchaeota archaeon]|nr:hypothetical protein [Candidatus Micrarchaeota archaeon]